MTDVEYVARVVIERVERSVVPKGTPQRRNVISSEDRVVRDKTEVASFTVRADSKQELRDMVVSVCNAAMPVGDVKGEPYEPFQEEEEEEDEENV